MNAAVNVEAGPIKLQGNTSPVTYMTIFCITIVLLFFIYAKYIHKRRK